MPLHADITSTITGILYIIVMDAKKYFHQWCVKWNNRYKQTMITHKKQKQFNVVVMKFKNSSIYVQKQIDIMLRVFHELAEIYMDDIVIFSKTLNKHFEHFRIIFAELNPKNVTLKPIKIFIGYPSIILLKQFVNVFGLTTTIEKLTKIFKLIFSMTFKALKTYLGFTDWLRMYVVFYATIIEPLQRRKTYFSIQNQAKKRQNFFFKHTMFNEPTNAKFETYNCFQEIFLKFTFLAHFDPTRILYANVKTSKQNGVKNMVFHVKNDFLKNATFKRSNIELILFLNKCFTSIEQKYWQTKMEIAGMVWLIKKSNT